MGKWKKKNLIDICKVFTDGNWIETKDQSPSGIRLVQTGNIGFGEFRPKSKRMRFISQNTFDRLNCTEILPGDLLVSRLPDPVGKSCLIPDIKTRMITSVDCTIIRPKDSILSEFLAYYQQSNQYLIDVQKRVTGTTRSRISRKNLGLVQIPIPPLPEQRRLVHLLDTAFAEIERARVLLERNLRNAGELFESRLGEVFGDKNWNTFQLKDHLHIKHGWAFKSKFFTDKSEYQLLTPGNFYESGGYKDRGGKQKYYDGEFPEAFLLNAGDLLLAMTEQAAGLLGSPLLVPSAGKYLHNQRLGLVEFTSDRKLSKRLLYYLFNTATFRNELYRTGTGVKVRHTSPTKICAFSAKFPDGYQEQEEVADHLDSILRSTEMAKTHYTRQLTHLAELKQSLLAKAFAGELLPKIAF